MSTTKIERPIELVPEVHRALLTKRSGVLALPMRPQPVYSDAQWGRMVAGLVELGHLFDAGDRGACVLESAFQEGLLASLRCPWGRGGDVLWCREPWAQVGRGFRYLNRDAVKGDDQVWLPAQRMPRAAARLVLKIVHVGIGEDASGAYVWEIEVERLS